jgi:PBP1b-binding outer membrane lipoprotein LpoB
MKKIIALIFLAILLFGCIQYERKYITVRPKPKNVTNVTNITNITEVSNVSNVTKEIKCEELIGEEKEKCAIERAIKNENPLECYALENESFTRCIYAVSKLNANYCYKLNRTAEIDLCLFNVSIENKNESACNNILNTSLKKKCLISFVSEKCRNGTSSLEIYSCDAIEKNDESRCDFTENKSLCLIKFSKERKNVCNKLESKMDRASCNAVAKDSDSECLILNGSQRDYCYKIFAIERGSCNTCSKINSTVYSDPCYFECAIATLNAFYCSKPTEESQRDNCYGKIAILTKNYTYCDEIKLKASKAMCQIDVAKTLLDMTICDYVDIQYRKTCYTILIGLPIPVENCLKINQLYSERDTCLLNAARREKNASICDYVSSQIKDYCIQLTK